MTIFDPPKPQDKLSILKRIPLFSSCTDEQLQLVAERSRLVEYKKGEEVYREGDRADAFYIVASGRLQVFSLLDGQKHVYTVLHNGDTFGEISLLTGETHSATIEALNDTLVLQLEKPDFDELINRVPSLVLYLSRLLSKRLRTKDQVGGATEAMVVAIYSATKGVGRTLFAVALATALRRETDRPVLLVDFNDDRAEPNRFFGLMSSHQDAPARRLWSEETLEQEIVSHPLGFDCLYAAELVHEEQGQSFVSPLVSGLAKRYRYILMDLPVEVGPTVLKALTQADFMYLVTGCTKDHVLRTKALMHQVREAFHVRDEQLKVIANLMDTEGERLNPAGVSEMLQHPVSFLLPHFAAADTDATLTAEQLLELLQSRASPYAIVVRRIARELGGVLIGLALGSGAALGLAHIGILKVLEREKIPIDIIAGSSIGALIGALWASGKSADEIEQLALKFQNPWALRALFLLDFGIPFFSVIIGAVVGILVSMVAGFWTGLQFALLVGVSVALIFGPLSGGPIQGARIVQFLEWTLGNKTFEETWIPLKVVASNPSVREEIVFESGRLVEAVRASISIPGIFKPVRLMGKLCLDGGVVNPIPVSVLKRAGAKRIIAVNVFPTTKELTDYAQAFQRKRAEREAQLATKNLMVRLAVLLRRELYRTVSPLVFDVIMRSMQSMEHHIAEAASHDADLTLRPTLPGSHWLEFDKPAKFIQRGEEEALRYLPKLKQLIRTDAPTALTTPDVPGRIHANDVRDT